MSLAHLVVDNAYFMQGLEVTRLLDKKKIIRRFPIIKFIWLQTDLQ